uniref:WRKY19-like zinc finger domain-containing protein n=1 Tax=Hyaloperonospora arabidopsidis (strain Emoy2) TaxID=559515 RepID=M4BN51_HYAAE
MDWMQPHDQLLHGSAPSAAPSFILVDANNRVRELTDPLKRQLGATRGLYQPPASDNGLSAAELEEQRQLEQQVQVQKQEMCFISPLPRPEVGRLRVPTTSHAFTYGGSRSSNVHSTPPLAPPVSPFASMALSAPAAPMRKSHNPFLSAMADQSPRLPSLNAMRNSPGTHLKQLGIASRPPPLSLRSFSDVSTLSSSSHSPSPSPSSLRQPQVPPQSKAPCRSLSNSSLSSTASTSPMLYSQSLPGVSFLQDRRRSRMSFDGSECSSILSPEDKESSMRLLSSSVGRSEGSSDAMTAAANAAAQAALNDCSARSGRVCRYANCSNIARSRGLCRTHGGGKRCSHPTCNKSAQANRKCIAHGGGTPCSFEDCEKTAQSRGLCKAHGGGARCKHPDCPKSSQSKGLCRGHGGGIKCKAEGCEKWVQKNGYCIKHGRGFISHFYRHK